ARGDGSQGLPDRAADTSSDRRNEIWTTAPRDTLDPSWLLRSVARLSCSVRCAWETYPVLSPAPISAGLIDVEHLFVHLGACDCLNDTSSHGGPDSSIVVSPRGIVKNESLRGFSLIGTGGAVIACSEHESKHRWLKRPVRASGQWPDCEV